MQYSKAFFDLQIHFARVVANLIDMPIEQTLLDYTNIYVRLELDRAFAPEHPIWRHYIDGLGQAADMSEWTYDFYLAQAEEAREQSMTLTFGCFSYVMCVIHRHRFRSNEAMDLEMPHDYRESRPDGHDEDRTWCLSVHRLDDCSRFRVLAVDPRGNARNTLLSLDRVIEQMPFPIQRSHLLPITKLPISETRA